LAEYPFANASPDVVGNLHLAPIGLENRDFVPAAYIRGDIRPGGVPVRAGL
jgi:hypothetical protein